MPVSTSRLILSLAFVWATLAAIVPAVGGDEPSNDARMTPLVRAVARVRPSVVNIRGSKTVADDAAAASLGAQQMKQVSGMGTGVVIDSRGYILTNYHVVQDVSQIRVTTFDRETVSGQIVARDPRTDLALIKVHTEKPLPIVPIGSSDSVMLAESVAAIGNAYGYEHTVTEGIVSELGRTVQVSDDQVYYDLIQTDAAINPGNSGGPLLNLKGEMIGINVAVRVGAQGIAFAIPINDAIDVAAELLRGIGDGQADCGFEVCTKYDSAEPATVVTAIAAGSSAEKSGLKVGDQLTSIDDLPCTRAIDVFRAMLGGTPDGELKVCFRRGETAEIAVVKLERASPKQAAVPPPQLAWDSLGIEVVPVDREAMRRINPSYDGGLRVAQVRPGSPAERENLRVGDVIVAMAEWKTESIENLNYILRQPEIQSRKYFKFYIFRNDEPLFGQIRIAQAAK